MNFKSRDYAFRVFYDGLSAFRTDKANRFAGSIERSVIHECDKAFSLREMFVNMHHGLAMWADWSLIFALKRIEIFIFSPPVD